jgi:hypothetical protein
VNSHESVPVATAKVAVAWGGLVIGGVTLSEIALLLTIIFTILQIAKLIRQEFRDRRQAKKDAEEFAKKLQEPE